MADIKAAMLARMVVLARESDGSWDSDESAECVRVGLEAAGMAPAAFGSTADELSLASLVHRLVNPSSTRQWLAKSGQIPTRPTKKRGSSGSLLAELKALAAAAPAAAPAAVPAP